MTKITKEQKLANIEEARKLYEEADKLIKKADKLISKGINNVQFCGHYECEPLSQMEYKGLINVHLYSGILKLEKLLEVKTEPQVLYDGSVDDSVKILCVEGLRFLQIGDPVEKVKKSVNFTFK